MIRFKLAHIGLACLVVLAFALAAPAAVIHVDDNASNDPGPGDPAISDPAENGTADHPFDAIQEGINAAAGGDEVLVAPGTYTGTGNRDLDFKGKAITVRGESGPEATAIDCQGAGRGFYFHYGEGSASVVDGLTITRAWNQNDGGAMYFCDSGGTVTNCIITGNTAGIDGGGISCARSHSRLTITNCTLSNNAAGVGGAVSCFNHSVVKMTECTVTGNTSMHGGGGVSCSVSELTMTDCMVSSNSDAHSYAGGVFCGDSRLTIENCQITGNWVGSEHSGQGGGLYCSWSVVTITNSSISNNTTWYDAGGMRTFVCTLWMADSQITGNASVCGSAIQCDANEESAIVNCLVSGNTGGGIRSSSGYPLVVANCTISNNGRQAPIWAGGGIYAEGPATITGCTITGNAASAWGGGLACYREGAVTAVNSILWGNTAPLGPEIALDADGTHGPSLSVAYTNTQGGQAAVYVEQGCTLDWGPGNLDVYPVFVDPDGPDDDPQTWQDNDYRLAVGSPCIDAGDNDAVPVDLLDLDGDGDTDEPVPFDLDGRARFMDDPATPDTGAGTPPIVDMGACEFGPVARAWRSVRSCGAAGDLAIALDAATSGNGAGAPTVEPRRGGIQRIEVGFSGPVVLADPAAVAITAGLDSFPPVSVAMLDDDTLAIVFKPGDLPDQRCYKIDLAGAIEDALGEPLAGDTDCMIRSLVGDVNDDGRMDLTDFALMKCTNGLDPKLPGHARYDVNTDGRIDLTDMALVKSLNGGSVTCP